MIKAETVAAIFKVFDHLRVKICAVIVSNFKRPISKYYTEPKEASSTL